MQSTLFLNNISVIDHAYIDNTGKIVGGSYHLSVEVAGTVDATEQVVVDFSTLKSDVKHLVDDKENGFDHKLWVVPGFSLCEIVKCTSEGIHINTSSLRFKQPRNAVKILDVNYIGSVLETAQRAIKQQLWEQLNVLYPAIHIDVSVQLSEVMFTGVGHVKKFRYTHGLKNSTSWGCQNIGHGHFSWLEIQHDALFQADCFDCQRGIQVFNEAVGLLNDAVFIWKENIVKETKKEITISYTTDRGYWEGIYDKSLNNIIILDTETTIENIVSWFVSQYGTDLEKGHVKSLFISEGLSKGSVKHFSY